MKLRSFRKFLIFQLILASAPSRLSDRHKFYAIPERVAGIETLILRNWQSFLDAAAVEGQALSQRNQVRSEQAEVPPLR